ncbi:hypothetical protein [Streptococcus oralis]|uniref:DUF2187 domain-containing protein n=1 Tax=Streptococcus oralis subsp. oralis TaxID=1891914 RepID=A0ABD6RG47_STROR|nr:hypothetical protein [Streptococcus oralis]ORO69764.1 hypothetical protein B7711_07975 [Streptococcus oralis subsp. oralis]
MTDTYTDYERFQIAKKEYDKELAVDKPVEIGDNDNAKAIGTVRQVIENETGIKVYVVESPDRPLCYTISKSVHDIFVK